MSKLILFLPDGEEKTYDMVDETMTVGRLSDNQIVIEDVSVSSHHAVLIQKSRGYQLRDLDSTNGTRVNGEPTREAVLEHGDRIRFGKIEAHYHSESDTGSRPLPEAENPSAEIAEASHLPSNFGNASPFKTKEKKKDAMGTALIGFAVLSLLAFAAALTSVLLLRPPQ